MLEWNLNEFDGEAKKATSQLGLISARLEAAEANLKETQMQRDIAYNQIEELKQAIVQKDTKIDVLAKQVTKTQTELATQNDAHNDLQSAFNRQSVALNEVKALT